MTEEPRWRLVEVEQRVCDVASEQLGIPRKKISPQDRLLEDLHCDSLDLVELFMEAEDAFDVTLPNDNENPTFKAVFTRQPFRLSDLAELVYLQQGTGKPDRRRWRKPPAETSRASMQPFTQLDGRWDGKLTADRPLFEPLASHQKVAEYRRRSDGMRCFLIPSAEVELGSDLPDAQPDETPKHVVQLDSFLIDAEPVSTTAYCRFLNSIGDVDAETLTDWLVLDAADDRHTLGADALASGVSVRRKRFSETKTSKVMTLGDFSEQAAAYKRSPLLARFQLSALTLDHGTGCKLVIVSSTSSLNGDLL
ncbi:MAG: phosphopantetheine-binding protein [Candidatus Paceibacterota bacterium]